MARRCVFIVVSLLVVVGMAMAAPTPLKFAPVTGYPLPDQTWSVAHGDFNQDGKPDMAVGWGPNQVRVFLATSPGQFGSGTDYTVSGSATSLVAGYFRGASHGLDLAVLHGTQVSTLTLLLNNGDGTFTTLADTPLNAPAVQAVAADFNKDGNIDLALLERVTSQSPNGGTYVATQIEILLSNGDGTFSTKSLTSVGAALSGGLAVADFDGDGNLDVATALQNPTRGAIFYGTGDGSLTLPPVYLAVNNPIPSGYAESGPNLTAVDANGDGYADLAILAGNVCGSACGEMDAHIFLNNANGARGFTFSNTFPVWTSGSGGALFAADLNGDNVQDLVYWNSAHYGGGNSFFAANGDGTFSPVNSDFGNTEISDYTARDMNLDGLNDLLTTSWMGNNVVLAINNTVTPNCAPPDSHALQVKICSPTNNSSFPSSGVVIRAAGNSPAGVGRLELWMDGVKQAQVLSDQGGFALSNVAPGTHTVQVIAVDKQLGFTTGSPHATATLTLTAVSDSNCTTQPSRSVVICAPQSNATVNSPVFIMAAIRPGSAPTTYVQVYVDGVKQYQTSTYGMSLTDSGDLLFQTNLPMSAGTHRITVQALDSAGSFKATVYATVGASSGGGGTSGGGGSTGGGGTGTCTAPTTARTVVICSPASGATVASPVHITASAKAGSSPIKVMQVYVDGVKKYEQASVSSIDTSLSMTAGAHRVTVQALDSAGAFKATENITVQ